MGFSVFIWTVIVVALLFLALCDTVFRYIRIQVKQSYLISGVGVLLVSILVYFGFDDNWILFNTMIFPWIQDSYLLKEAWFTIAFFKDIWIGFFIALMSISLERNPLSRHYRMFKNFGHNKMLILVVSIAVVVFFNRFQIFPEIKSVALNIAIYTAVYYWRFGWISLVYVFKSIHIPTFWGTALALFIPILVGEYFLIPIFLTIGIGISDIWMDYQKRGASQTLFSLDFN